MDFDMGEVCAQRFNITHLIDVKLDLRPKELVGGGGNGKEERA